jgi:hypothetical protein
VSLTGELPQEFLLVHAVLLILTLSSVDATTSHVIIQKDEIGRWRVYWRIVRYHSEVDGLAHYLRHQMGDSCSQLGRPWNAPRSGPRA